MSDIAFNESCSIAELITHYEGRYPFWFTSYQPRHFAMKARLTKEIDKQRYVIGDLYHLDTLRPYSKNAQVRLDDTKGWQPFEPLNVLPHI
jgi:hypothetical protein